MQINALKLIIFIILALCISGCAETVNLHTEQGTDSIEVISRFWFYIRVGLSLIFVLIGVFSLFIEEAKWLVFLGFCTIALLTSVGLLTTVTRNDFLSDSELVAAKDRYQEMSQLELNYSQYEQRRKLGAERYKLKKQIEKAKNNINILKQDKLEQVLPLKQEYAKMYSQYYPQLTDQLKNIEINDHETLLRNCDQYLKICSLLSRVAKLDYYINKLNNRLDEIKINLIKLDDNLWDLERTFELSQIFSSDELENVEKLIAETQGKINSEVPPPERQDIANLEEKILSNILSS